MDLAVSHADQHISRIVADANTGHFGLACKTVLLFTSLKVVDEDFFPV